MSSPEVGAVFNELGFESPLNSVAWCPDGKHLAALLTSGRYTIWTWPELREVRSGSATAIGWHPDGRLSVSTEGAIRLIDLEDGSTTVALRSNALALRWSDDGIHLGAATRTATIFAMNRHPNSSQWEPVTQVGRTGTFALGPAGSFAYSSEGRLLIGQIGRADRLDAGPLDGEATHMVWARRGGPLFVATSHSLYSHASKSSTLDHTQRADVWALDCDPSGKVLALSIGGQFVFAAADNPARDLYVSRSPRGNAFDVQCHPHERTWAWACGSVVSFVHGPLPPSSKIEIPWEDLPILAHHLVLAGLARPDLLQDFAATMFQDALRRAQPNGPSDLAAVIATAKGAAHQPDALWRAWVLTVRKTELENAAKQLNRMESAG